MGRTKELLHEQRMLEAQIDSNITQQEIDEYYKDKERIVSEIKDRIICENRKHKELDWQEIAARKIYSSFIKNPF